MLEYKKGVNMEDTEKRLTEEQVDQKVEEIKEDIKSRTYKKVQLDTGLYTSYKLAEYKNKKARSRRRNKVQKASRKANR